MAETSPRVQIRNWIKGEVEGESEVQLPDLTARAIDHFSGQKAFIRAFLAETLPEMVYEQARTVLRLTRDWGEPILLGDSLVTPEVLARKARVLKSRWSGWFERVGDRHINLMAMTREDLRQAAEHRRTQAMTELGYATLWDEMAARMKKGQTVAQRFKPEDIEALRVQYLEQAEAEEQTARERVAA